MWKVGFAALAVSLSLYVPAFCEEQITSPRGFALGFSIGQRANDACVSLNVTSPYMHLKMSPNPRNYCAIRISGDARIKSAIPIGGTTDSLMGYAAARIGVVGALEVSNLIRMYGEFGCISVFPTTELASSTHPCFGAYAYYGSEFFLGKNLLTRNTGIFMEIGLEGTQNHRFDKLVNSPLVGWGATVCSGMRFYLQKTART